MKAMALISPTFMEANPPHNVHKVHTVFHGMG